MAYVWLSLVVYDMGVLRAKLVLSSHKGDGTLFHAELETLRVIGSDTPYRGMMILLWIINRKEADTTHGGIPY